MKDKKIPVAVLAATGSVGQRFVQLLDGHPWFEVVALTGSERSRGQIYGETCRWLLPEPMPAWAQSMRLNATTPQEVHAPLIFSALPADTAREVEPLFARAGAAVFSNASSYRTDPLVPILLPEVNADQAWLVEIQKRQYGWSGSIVTNSNCTSTGMTVALKPLLDEFGIKRVFAVSLQALSGAGYPGVASMDIIDNVVPYIANEEEKVEQEPLKMLGKIQNDQLQPANFTISAHTNRVAVSDGHLVCLSVELGKKAPLADVEAVLRAYQAPLAARNLPSTPLPVLQITDKQDRPQPRLDRMAGKGMTTVLGRLRKDPLFDIKFVVLSHNTIRGAAGGSIYNAELLVKLKLAGK